MPSASNKDGKESYEAASGIKLSDIMNIIARHLQNLAINAQISWHKYPTTWHFWNKCLRRFQVCYMNYVI